MTYAVNQGNIGCVWLPVGQVEDIQFPEKIEIGDKFTFYFSGKLDLNSNKKIIFVYLL